MPDVHVVGLKLRSSEILGRLIDHPGQVRILSRDNAIYVRSKPSN